MATGIPQSVLDQVNNDQGRDCLPPLWARKMPHPQNDTTEFLSPAWQAAGLPPSVAGITVPGDAWPDNWQSDFSTWSSGRSTCSLYDNANSPGFGPGANLCVAFPHRFDGVVFNMGSSVAPATPNVAEGVDPETQCAKVCSALGGPPDHTKLKCSRVPTLGTGTPTEGCEDEGDLDCCPSVATGEQCGCPKGGYKWDDSTKQCSCESVQPWYLTGEVSPWGTLTEAQRASLITAYGKLQATTMTSRYDPSKTIDFLAPADYTKQTAACKANEINKKNQEDNDHQIMIGVIALIGALLLCFVLFKIVRTVRRVQLVR